jgi:hypothetical protein
MNYCFRHIQLAELLLLIALCTSFFGCEGVMAYGVGKTYLDKKPAPIYITENEKEIAGCNFVKHVSSSTAWGGLALQDEALERVISDITHEAYQAGADTLLIRNKSKGFMGSSASGDAYCCKNSSSSTTVINPQTP